MNSKLWKIFFNMSGMSHSLQPSFGVKRTLPMNLENFSGGCEYNINLNKNAFQLRAHLPLAGRKLNTYNLILKWPWHWKDLNLVYDLDLRQVKLSSTDVHIAKLAFSMRWPWPLPNDLDSQTWPRYGQDVRQYQKWSFYVNWFKSFTQPSHFKPCVFTSSWEFFLEFLEEISLLKAAMIILIWMKR